MAENSDILQAFPAASEYLTNIYLIQRDYGHVSNVQLAQWMHVSNPAVTQAINRLKKLELVAQPRYKHILLTEKGRTVAMGVLRRHYLLEHLLVGILKYPWDKADDEAHVLQNHFSNALTDHLEAYLGHPETCPHGNPLPGSRREREILAAPTLISALAGDQFSIVRITEEGEAIPEILPFCELHGIKPLARFRLAAVGDSELSLSSIDFPAEGDFSISRLLARHIGIQRINVI